MSAVPPQSDQAANIAACPKGANWHIRTADGLRRYSITSSAVFPQPIPYESLLRMAA
jgi:hypothetical protein